MESVLFGQSLRRLRRELAWSPEQLAEAAGMTLNYIGTSSAANSVRPHICSSGSRSAIEIDVLTFLGDFKRGAIPKLLLEYGRLNMMSGWLPRYRRVMRPTTVASVNAAIATNQYASLLRGGSFSASAIRVYVNRTTTAIE